jgi:hypothetical protein
MKQALRNAAAGFAAAALLMGVSAGAANAYYLGYGNGDPGNWSFYQEQHPHQAKAQTSGLRGSTAYRHYAASQQQKHA